MFIYIAYGECVDFQLHETKAGKSFHKVLIKDLYEKRLEFSLWPDESGKRVVGDITVGCKLCVHGVINSREYNGKHYTDVAATRVEVLTAPIQIQPQHQSTPEFDLDDIPF